jgi:hypothetical protein
MKLTKKNLEKSLLITKLKREINQIKSDLKKIHNHQIKLEIQKKALQFQLRGLGVKNAFRL